VYLHTASGFSLPAGADGSTLELALNTGHVLDVASGPAGDATLLRAADGAERLEIERGGSVQVVSVSPRADRVIAAGDRWLVLSTLWPDVSIVGDDPARVIADVALPDTALPALRPAASVTERWLGFEGEGVPLRLSDDRFVLVRELNATCARRRGRTAPAGRVLWPERP
jgi:hypothetical protein